MLSTETIVPLCSTAYMYVHVVVFVCLLTVEIPKCGAIGCLLLEASVISLMECQQSSSKPPMCSSSVNCV